MMPGTLATGIPQEGSRMNYVLSRLLVISACLFIGEAAIAGEIPTAGELIESLPLLDSENGDLDSFALTFAMNAGDGVNLEWQVVWEKDGQQGFLLCVGDAKTPVWFQSGDEALFFDISHGRIYVMDKIHCRFHLRNEPIADDSDHENKTKLEYGFSTDTDAHAITIDLVSMFGKPEEAAVVASDEGFEYTAKAYTALFDRDRNFRRWVVLEEPDEPPLMSLTDIDVNNPGGISWPAIPDRQRLERDFEVVNLRDMKGFNFQLAVFGCILGPLAIDDDTKREHPFLADGNWEDARQYVKRADQLKARLTPGN